MIIDNKNRTVSDWIIQHTKEGKMDIVTGYFTIGALAFLSREINSKISKFRFILGDIVNQDIQRDRTLDLLNENISVESALKLKAVAQEAYEFLSDEKVELKTLEPNFCHAKLYLFSPNDQGDIYFIQGSANLTEAGIGLKKTANIELNIAEYDNNSNFQELASWFDELWNKPQAYTEKTVREPNGKTIKKDFKKYLLEQIERIFTEYQPDIIYYKILFELFGEQVVANNSDENLNRQIGRLENTEIYKSLYEFQQKGVLSLIQMLQKYNGAILADAVGLGKTWSALAVMKFFQMQGYEVLLLCPKKLQNNWQQYKKFQDSRFEIDSLEYFIRFHTDLQEGRFDKYEDRSDKLFISDKPKLIVIDESHNLRNDKSIRYDFLINNILAQNNSLNTKVLLLSATPINNSLKDIRNQFKIIVHGKNDGFTDTLGIKNLDYTFNQAEKKFGEWSKENNPKIGDFVSALPANFFRLTDALTVARTRKMIAGNHAELFFPQKTAPKNLFITPKDIGDFENFEELFGSFPPTLSAYQPSSYTADTQEDLSVLENEKQRDFFLVKMMYILMVKRLESSCHAFQITVQRILKHHQYVLDLIKEYQTKRNNTIVVPIENNTIEGEDASEMEELDLFSIGKSAKRQIKISDIDQAGKLELFKKDLKQDIQSLERLQNNLQKMVNNVEKEQGYSSADSKLEALIKEIQNKRSKPDNNNNPKVIIFTVYKDTAQYLFDELLKRGFQKIAMVSGDYSKTSDSREKITKFEPILQRFAPFTKLFKEKKWLKFIHSENADLNTKYQEWQNWIKQEDKITAKLIENPIDILIATDALSEGQNLQDCDMVINYDIHWNPVRVIQRFGRIDRLGSPNDKIFGINFWPTDNINAYLNLQKRIEKRMTAMKLAGAEVPEKFSKTFIEMNEGDLLETMQKERMMQQMQISWEDIEINDEQFGFDDLSLEKFRQDLLLELKKKQDFLQKMPNGVYSGFIKNPNILPQDGIIALLGFPARKNGYDMTRYQKYEIVYSDWQGNSVKANQKEILELLSQEIKTKPNRQMPEGVDKGQPEAIEKLAAALKNWIKKQAVDEIVQPDGSVKQVIGESVKQQLLRLKQGDSSVLNDIKKQGNAENIYQSANFDLITWIVVHSENTK